VRDGGACDPAVLRALPADRREACPRIRLHRRDRVRIHHGAQRNGIRDRLRVYQFRQRDDVSADPVDPAAVDRHERRPYPLGKGASCQERPALMGGAPKTLRNTIILVAGLLVFWQLMYWIIGDLQYLLTYTSMSNKLT